MTARSWSRCSRTVSSSNRATTGRSVRLPARSPEHAGTAYSSLDSPDAVMPESFPTVRCAIYTRKSTDEGLDRDFNSLDAQREAAEAYIRSQRHLGWTLVPHRYDDGGFSGA